MANAYSEAIKYAKRKRKWTGPITGEERLAGSALPQSGRWTATQTGARGAAQLKVGIKNAKDVMGAAQDTDSFEKFIRGQR